jgi:hypothetical protein
MRKEDYDTLIANLTPAIAKFEEEHAHELVCYGCKTTRAYEVTGITTYDYPSLAVNGWKFNGSGWVRVTVNEECPSRIYCPLCADQKGLS